MRVVTGPTRAEAFRRNRDVHMAHCGRKRQTYKFRRTRGMQRGIHDDVLACTKRPLIFRRVPCNILDHDVLFLRRRGMRVSLY